MKITGKVYKIGEPTTVSPTYEKRELVIETNEQHPQRILIEFSQGKCNDKIDKLAIGQDVTVGINLRGREWVNPQGESKYLNSIQGWRIQ